MNKFYLIDKPLNFTSFDVIRILRKTLNTKKMGHTGTLDPLATGGLLIAVGNYTKLIPYFEKDTKEYEFTVNLDGTTDSFDLAEEINFLDKSLQKKYSKELTIDKLQKIIEKKFTGKITQVPPKYSALKINGRKACDLVREGKDVEIKSREVTILNIEIQDFKYPSLSLKALVTAGTYIRSIAADLGELLGTGGYVTKLRRTKIGALDISLGQILDNFDEKKSLDIKQLFRNKEFVKLDKEVLKKINHGLKVVGKFDFKVGEDLFVYDENEVTNIIQYDGEKLIPKRKI
ncbi:MAG: tRNA pseudouridine(55) synthase TruB [Candidatus Gracilibacteria bacterium]